MIQLKVVKVFLLSIILSTLSCSKQVAHSIEMDSVYPWCIVAFDSLERSPAQRIELLQELGFTKYAYDCDLKYLDDMDTEFQLAAAADIEITAVWMWLNAKRDSLGKLSHRNERIFEIVKHSDQRPTFWVSFSENYFKDKSHAESMTLATEMIRSIDQKASEIGCKIELYNHGGWFGDPKNMIEIIEALPDLNLEIVYNFHHAHLDLDGYEQVIRMISPYLSAVNLNGMRKAGPKILPIGEGEYERDMIRQLIENGFNGPWGILGHVRSRDVRVVLEQNLEGLKSVLSSEIAITSS